MDILSFSTIIISYICVYIHYLTHLSYLNYNLIHLLLDTFHVFFTFYLAIYPIRILLSGKGNLNTYNLIMLVFLIQGVVLKGCIINKIHDMLDHRFNWLPIKDRLTFNLDKEYVKGSEAWLKGTKLMFIYIIVINIIFLYRNT